MRERRAGLERIAARAGILAFGSVRRRELSASGSWKRTSRSPSAFSSRFAAAGSGANGSSVSVAFFPFARPSTCPQPRRRRGTSATSAVSSCRRRAGGTPQGGSACRRAWTSSVASQVGRKRAAPRRRRPGAAPAAGRPARGPPRPGSAAARRPSARLLHARSGRGPPSSAASASRAGPKPGQYGVGGLDARLGLSRSAAPSHSSARAYRSARRRSHVPEGGARTSSTQAPARSRGASAGRDLACAQFEELVAVQGPAAQGLANLLGCQRSGPTVTSASCRSGATPPGGRPRPDGERPVVAAPTRSGSSTAAASPARRFRRSRARVRSRELEALQSAPEPDVGRGRVLRLDPRDPLERAAQRQPGRASSRNCRASSARFRSALVSTRSAMARR